MTAFIPRRAARVLAPLALVLLAACSQQELYGQLNERQANEMVAVLRNAGLEAEKAPARDGKSFVVRILEQPKIFVKGSNDDLTELTGAGEPGAHRPAQG